MSDFYQGGNRNKGGDRGGRGGFKKFGGNRGGGDRGGFGGERREVEMHEAICGECGNTCQVPFRPSGDKPVFCNDCFASKRSDRGEERGSKERYISTPRQDKSYSENKINFDEMKIRLENIGEKLDRLTSILELNFATKTLEKVTKVKAKKAKK